MDANKDAARYRWLNATDNFLIHIDSKPVRLKCGDPLDAWIDARIVERDAAMREQESSIKGEAP